MEGREQEEEEEGGPGEGRGGRRDRASSLSFSLEHAANSKERDECFSNCHPWPLPSNKESLRGMIFPLPSTLKFLFHFADPKGREEKTAITKSEVKNNSEYPGRREA